VIFTAYRSKTSFLTKVISIVIAAGVTVSCDDGAKKLAIDPAGCSIPTKYQTQVADGSMPYQPYRIEIENDRITWNGQYVSKEKLTEYAQRVSEKGGNAGGITFRVFDVSCDKRLEVRDALSRSDLCRKKLCWEDDKSTKPPIDFPHDGNFNG
jgi:hypothetical protein